METTKQKKIYYFNNKNLIKNMKKTIIIFTLIFTLFIQINKLSSYVQYKTINNIQDPATISYSPDGNYIAINSLFLNQVGSLYIIDAHNFQIIKEIPIGKSFLRFSYSPNGDYIACGADNNIYIVDTSNYEITNTISLQESPQLVIYSPDGNYIACSTDNNIFIIDTNNYNIQETINNNMNPLFLLYSPNGKYIAVLYVSPISGSTTTYDLNLTIINTSNYNSSTTFTLTSSDPSKGLIATQITSTLSKIPTTMSFSTDSRYLSAVNGHNQSSNGTSFIVDLSTLEIINKIDLGVFTVWAAYSPDNKYIAYLNGGNGTNNGSVYIVDTSNYQIIKEIEVGLNPSALLYSLDGKYIVVSNYGDGVNNGSITIIDTKTFNIINNIEVEVGPYSMAYSLYNNYIAVLNTLSSSISILEKNNLIIPSCLSEAIKNKYCFNNFYNYYIYTGHITA